MYKTYISDFHILKTNRIMRFCNLFMERASYYSVGYCWMVT